MVGDLVRFLFSLLAPGGDVETRLPFSHSSTPSFIHLANSCLPDTSLLTGPRQGDAGGQAEAVGGPPLEELTARAGWHSDRRASCECGCRGQSGPREPFMLPSSSLLSPRGRAAVGVGAEGGDISPAGGPRGVLGLFCAGRPVAGLWNPDDLVGSSTCSVGAEASQRSQGAGPGTGRAASRGGGCSTPQPPPPDSPI